MTKIKQIRGNYKEALNAVKLSEEFIKESTYEDALTAFFKDLERSVFVNSHDRTFDDHISTWMDRTVSKTYSQGNMDASLFDLIKIQFCLSSPKFLKEGTDRNEGNRVNYFHGQNSRALSFAYYDDEGVPCGVSITSSMLDPEIWTATIIRNTPAAPEDRDVMIIGLGDIIDGSDIGTNSEAIAGFLNFLKSENGEETLPSMQEIEELTPEKFKDYSIKQLLMGVLLENGKVDINRLAILSEKIKPGISEKHQAKIALKEEHAKILKKQFDKYANIDTQMEAFSKKDAELKRSKLAENKSWYDNELLKLREFKDPELDATRKQSFIRRNAAGLTVDFIGVVAAVGLVLTAILAPPLGLPVLVTLLAGAVGAGFLALASAMRINASERKLTEYEQKITELPAKEKALSAERREKDGKIHEEFKPREAEFIKSLEGPFEAACRECLARDDLTTEDVIVWSKEIFPVADEVEPEGYEHNLMEDDLPVIDPQKMDSALQEGQSLVNKGLSINVKSLPLPVVKQEKLPETEPLVQEPSASHGIKASK